MKDYGKQRSTIRPLPLEITEKKVFISTDIVEVNEPKVSDQDGFKGFEFNLVEYDKDEYITLQSEKNDSLEQQLTDTQIALTEVYEMTLI